MKKQLIALLTIPVLALTSCNSSKYSLEEVLNFATEKVNTFTNPESVYSKYSVVGEGQLWISIILKMKKVFIHF